MKSLFVVLSTVAILASCGRQESAAEITAAKSAQASKEIVVAGFSTKPINGGINPAARGSVITVNFVAGSNACMASHAKFEIKQIVRKGNAKHIVVTRTPVDGPRVMCTAEYMPVHKSLSTVVHGKAGDVVIVDNVLALGRNIPLSL